MAEWEQRVGCENGRVMQSYRIVENFNSKSKSYWTGFANLCDSGNRHGNKEGLIIISVYYLEQHSYHLSFKCISHCMYTNAMTELDQGGI